VIEAFSRMGAVTTCTCTPYLAGNLPRFGEHLAWAESSAVCFANSVMGARSNREGGPSALAAALTGRTPAYGMHLDERRSPNVTVEVVEGPLFTTHHPIESRAQPGLGRWGRRSASGCKPWAGSRWPISEEWQAHRSRN
jgi:predicted aconitase